ncbi:MAG TPA: alpha/beta hydrolase [Betaproteobacteria bacterium]|nr:alpha/beta hydrolase [Betaproteobacteria bacterium]
MQPFTRPIPPAVQTTLALPEQHIYYRIYRPQTAAAPRRLLLLHGGGVGGELTWGAIISQLRHWSEILVPDLRGAGDTRHPSGKERGFEAEAVAADITALLQHLHWENIDLGGYSFGGLVAMLLKARRGEQVNKTYLIEAALLGRMTPEETIASRDRMLHAAKKLRIREQTEEGLEIFLDVVSPNRTRGSKSEAIARERLSRRPVGLACAVECVSHASRRIDRSALIAAQAHVSSFIGERSHPQLYGLCQNLAAQRDDWRCHLIQGADHALPFKKPYAIARLMNEDLMHHLTEKNN